MPIVPMVNPKGGVGKTTLTLVLAGEIANRGASVTIIDADPNQPFKIWKKRTDAAGVMPANLSIMSGVTEENLIDAVDEASETSTFVLVDLEGSRNMAVMHATARADYVLIPVQGTQLDADQAGAAVAFLRQQQKALRRAVLPHCVVLTRTSAAIVSRTTSTLVEAIRNSGVPMLGAQLVQREAFATQFATGGTIYTMPEGAVGDSALLKAQQNSASLLDEFGPLLKQAMEDQNGG
jgi:chromosome partitioning protein